MVEQLWKFILEIPQAVAKFGNFLVSPINERYLNISPLALLGITGTTILIGLIVVHVVKLFI